MNFERALKLTLAYEGGYVDDPDDPGGATNRGVTQRVYDAWRAGQDPPRGRRPVRSIEPAEVEAIYRERYWRAARCDDMPWPLCAALFDAAVLCGVRQGTRMLQRSLGVTADGVLGPATLRALGESDPRAVTAALIDERRRFLARVAEARPISAKFLAGWHKRCDQLASALGVAS